ncbi:hypothetical protein T4A_12163 [Trichinella pseudospiralis]|uniref:Uncharacterized protein n=1 Tax=Trichinella pseudospiralis TaxID=6337 RepID=A0A0V1E136_TRIPS|nr:hypothetical protein T4A_12163 [Trichinella pseudospiralis]
MTDAKQIMHKIESSWREIQELEAPFRIMRSPAS